MYKIPQDKIDDIRSAINVVNYISQFLNLKKEGRNFKGLCPFHQEKTPSFVVSPEKQFYHCFGCGRGGNLYKFIMDYEKLNFVEAVTKAADFAGIALPKIQEKSEQEITYTQQLYEVNETACLFFEKELYKENNKRFLNYFLDRKLSEATIKKFRLSYAPDSFDALLKQKPEFDGNVRLELRGFHNDADYCDRIKRQIAESRYSDFITMVEFDPSGCLEEIYQKADLVVLLSNYEGFGLPVLEAGLAGLLVVVSNIQALRELAGRHAVYIHLGDSSDAVAKNVVKAMKNRPELRYRKEVISTYSWEIVFEKHIVPAIIKPTKVWKQPPKT